MKKCRQNDHPLWGLKIMNHLVFSIAKKVFSGPYSTTGYFKKAWSIHRLRVAG